MIDCEQDSSFGYTPFSLDASNDRGASHRRVLQNTYPGHRSTFGIIGTLLYVASSGKYFRHQENILATDLPKV